ncbi:MAG: SCO family protein [Chitinophagales bacterium]
MKNLLLYLGFCILFSAACKNNTEEKKACCKKPESSTSSTYNSDATLHDISSVWTTQDKKTLRLNDIKSTVIVAAMIFTNCQGACPRITADLQRIEKAIPADKLKDVTFLLISMDPERDTPAQLTAFAKEHQLDLKRWLLLTGSESDVLEISNVLNVRIKKNEDGTFDHSNIIHIINSKGNIVHQQVGLAMEPTESIEKINELLSE